MVLMVDGPSLGGFVCPITVTTTDLWKMGQARPADTIHFTLVDLEYAYKQRVELTKQVAAIRQAAMGAVGPQEELLVAAAALTVADAAPVAFPETKAVLKTMPATEDHPGAQYRWAVEEDYWCCVVEVVLVMYIFLAHVKKTQSILSSFTTPLVPSNQVGW